MGKKKKKIFFNEEEKEIKIENKEKEQPIVENEKEKEQPKKPVQMKRVFEDSIKVM